MAESAQTIRPIVVGTDLQPAARAAADWAAQRAQYLGLPLLLVTSTPGIPIPPRTSVYEAMRSPDYLTEVKARAGRRLEEEAVRLREAHPGVTVDTLVSEGDAAGVLVDLSRTARFTVIGTHGKPDITARLLGGVAEGVISNAVGTVVAVPPGAYHVSGPVVTGIDDPDRAHDVLRIAHTEAQFSKRPLVVLHAWHEAVFGTPYDVPVLIGATGAIEGEIREVMAEALARYHAQFDDVTATVDVVEGNAREVLVDRSRSASSLVIGARGKGGFLGLLLGSTSRFVVRHSQCPVIVVRPRPA